MPVLPALAVVGKVAGAVGAVKGAVDAFKKPKTATQLATGGGAPGTPGSPQVDIGALDAQVREIARKNAIESQQLEQQLTPEVSLLRKNSIEGLLGDISSDPYSAGLRESLLGDFTRLGATPGVERSDLSNAAYDRISSDLALGGELPLDVRNAILRRAASTAGRVGGGPLDLARDIGARDLGLSSLDLLNSRVNAAVGAGGMADQFALNQRAQEGNLLQQRLAAAGLVSDIGARDASRRLAIANLGQSIAPPQVGLDPGSVASVAIGNQNALQAYLANQRELAAQQSNARSQSLGNLVGALPGAIGAVGGLLGGSGGSSSSGSYSLPSFDTTLGYTPSLSTPTTYTAPSFGGSFTSTPSSDMFSVPDLTSKAGFFCWVARSAYGADNPKWLVFREWMVNEAPAWLRKLYIKHGPRFAKWLDAHAWFKPVIRALMNPVVERGAA